jgi:hypothetical protein
MIVEDKEDLERRLNLIWSDATTSDLTILVEEDGKVLRYKAHSQIVAGYFDKFERDSQDASLRFTGKDKILTREILISGVEPMCFKEILRWIYLGRAKLSSHNVLPILHFSHDFGFSKLGDICFNSLKSLVSDHEACIMLEQSIKYKLSEAKQTINRYKVI